MILTSTGPVIIDWEGAARGPALLDVAMTWVVVGFSDVPETGLAAMAVRRVQSLFTNSFVRAAGPLDQTWRAIAVRHRLADPNLLPPSAPAWNASPTTELAHRIGHGIDRGGRRCRLRQSKMARSSATP